MTPEMEKAVEAVQRAYAGVMKPETARRLITAADEARAPTVEADHDALLERTAASFTRVFGLVANAAHPKDHTLYAQRAYPESWEEAAPWFRLGMLAVVTGTYGLGKIDPAISHTLLEANVKAMRGAIKGFVEAVDQAEAEGAGVEQDAAVRHWFDRLREVLVVIKPQQAAGALPQSEDEWREKFVGDDPNEWPDTNGRMLEHCCFIANRITQAALNAPAQRDAGLPAPA